MNSSKMRDFWIALVFLAPNFAGFLAFTLVPVAMSFAGSFTTWSLRPSMELRFVGLDNYFALFADPNFYFYFYNTIYMMAAIPFAIAGSLGLAVLLNGKMGPRRKRSRWRLSLASLGVSCVSATVLFLTGSQDLAFVLLALGMIGTFGFALGSIAYRTFYYLPFFTAGAGTILLWTQLYNPDFGLINQTIESVFSALGIRADPPGWLASTRSLLGFLPWPDHFNNGGFGLGAREAMMIMGIWSAIGGNNMLLYLAGLANIPPELYEAAEIDGAGSWGKFRYVTLPQLAPTTFFISVTSFVYGLQGGFEQARLMTAGGPAGATTTLSYYIYNQGFGRLDLAFGSAIAWVMFIMIFGITLVQWHYAKRDVAG